MSLKCNTCGAMISLSIHMSSKEEINRFIQVHFGRDQPEWHRKKRKQDDADCKRMAEGLLRK